MGGVEDRCCEKHEIVKTYCNTLLFYKYIFVTTYFHHLFKSLRKFRKRAHPWGVLVLLKFYWAPDIVEFVLGRFSHFNIAIAYSNSTFCGTWTRSFCEFTKNFSKTSTPLLLQHCSRGVLVFLNFVKNSSEHQILWSLCSVDFHTLTLQLPIHTLDLDSVIHKKVTIRSR